MKRARPKLGLLFVLGMLAALLPVGALTPAAAAPEIVAYDMVGSSSLNLVSHTNAFAGAFASDGDGFEKYQRGVSLSIPFAVLDDSLVTFPGDSQGIIDDNNLDIFFGVVDTENADNSGPVSASWVFDVAGYEDLTLAINMGAMGDFEAASDSYEWTYSIDGGATAVAFTSSVDEAASLTYTLADGNSYTLDDPLAVNGVTLSNVLQTLTVPLSGSGSELAITFTAETDGGTEGYAAQDIVISGEPVAPAAPELVINEVMQNPDAVFDNSGEWFELFNP
ncbi:MAG: hypothetical protein QNJ81_08775, partial [Acidimicrobiia bacterium]|nr:hypothetical protein [Acidimicrobiia bacterium]